MKKLFTHFCLLGLLVWNTNTKAQVINGLIQHFKFDNSYTNEAGNVTFSASSFTTDREGNANSAIAISYSTQSQATIPGLPYGSAPRTISFWAKANQFFGLNYDPVFTYGTGTSNNAFSGCFSADRVLISAHTSHATWILGFGNQNVAGTWYHFTMTYDGTNAKIYRNGVLLGSEPRTWNTINNNDIFKLGLGVAGEQWFSGAIDDLKIFDRAIDATEALQLYQGDIDVCSNLLAYYNFDDPYNLSDHTETIPFTTTDPMYHISATAGRVNYALQTYQQATQPRTISLPGLPTGNNPRTIVFWLYTSSQFSVTQTFFSYGAAANAQTFGLYNNASGKLVFYGYGAGNDVTTSATISRNTWTQIAVVHNSNMVKIYTNGVLRHSFIPANTLNTASSTFKIGSFDGGVDDLAIYSRALSFAEIEHLYINGALNCPFPAGTNSFPVEYTFDNTLNNTDGLNNFVDNGLSFVNDRSANPQKALAIDVNKVTTANISILPKGSAARSVSLWYKVNSNSGNPGIFNYGGSEALEKFGLYLGATGNPIFQASGTDHAFGGNYAANTWHQAIVTYDGTVVKMYMNGTLLGSQPYTLATAGSNNFKLGNGAALNVDDLKIYDSALSQIEIYNSFNSTSSSSLPVLNLSSVSTTITTANIAYQINPNGGIATSVINYGLSNNNLSSQTSGFYATGASPTNSSAIISGLLPNTTYYYQVVVTNSVGTTSSAINSFTTSDASQITEYRFNNTHTDINGNNSFDVPGTSFVADRNANANAALNLPLAGVISATISGLPSGNASRSVSIWYKVTTNADYPGIFGYGANAANQKFGLYLGPNGNPIFQAYGNDKDFGSNYMANTWNHAVLTFDGLTIKMYMNGILLGQQAYTLSTASSSVFSLGSQTLTILSVDDLKLFDYALTAAEVNNLYNYNVAVLPVNLLSFTAKAQQNQAILNWLTASETNNSHFVVKHSTNAVDFVELSKVSAKGVNDASYQYIHNQATKGLNYYQLLQVDNDGKTTVLGTKTLNFGLAPSDINVSLNPTTNLANISFAEGTFHSAKLLNVNGQVLHKAEISKTQQSLTFSLSNYPSGVYFVHLLGDSQSAFQKIIKQ